MRTRPSLMTKNKNSKPSPYSNYYIKFRCVPEDFGKNRKQHFKICNEKRIEHLKIHQGEGSSFHDHLFCGGITDRVSCS